jgi:flagellar hook-length control protein FliK
MIIDQLTPHLPKDNEEVNAQVKRLQAMLDAATVVDPALEGGDEERAQDLHHRQSPYGDSPAVSLPRRNTAKDDTGTTKTSVMSFMAEMHAAGLKISAKSEITSSKNSAMKGTTITMVPSTTNLTDNAPRRREQ